MNFTLTSGDALQAAGALLVLPVFDSDLTRPEGPLADADLALDGLLRRAAAEEGFKGKAEQTFVFHTHGRLKADRVVLVGLGGSAGFRPEALRQAAGRAAKTSLRLKAGAVALALPAGLPELAEAVRAALEGFALGCYRFDRYRTQGEAREVKPPARVQLYLPEGTSPRDAALQEAFTLAQVVSESVNWARDLVNEPAAVINPTTLAQAVERACKPLGLKVTVSGRRDIEKLRMGMFLAVAQGSVQEPRLIQVSYVPRDAKAAARPPLALVGKAITFDSGGLSLKTTEGMLDMKVDMAGSAAVFGAMRVIAHLKPPFPVHAFVGACENMLSGSSYKLGDVLHSRLGKTVEVTNTDAEGRLVLGDVLTLATESKPFQLVDLATLTGACMIALGHYVVGTFGVDEEAVDSVLAAGQASGEMLWRLPMVELNRDTLRSDIADMKNSGERYGGAINAALFLKEFVGDTPWVHLDIAGPATAPRERGYQGKGATGVGVRTLVELVRQRAAQPLPEGAQVKAKRRGASRAGARTRSGR